MMRHVWILLALAGACGALVRMNHSATPTPESEVAAFFKLAHSTSLMRERVKFLAGRLRSDYRQLCLRVPNCDAMLLRMWAERAEGAKRRAAEMERLKLVLMRLLRPGPL